MARFAETSCSQCGKSFGPGDHGYSHCDQHREPDINIQQLSRGLVEEGKIIEAGWIGMRAAAIDPNASETQLNEMRMAFFGGAQHLFSSIMYILEPGEEPTDKDLKRMDHIRAELDGFIQQFADRNIRTQGSA